ncbi:MAG: ketoacyl-synthetase C-terminal extension domain-containing protein, partial [Streptosporangiaceae bacterium]
ERLSDAQRNGRRILAVVRGSVVNQDGASTGMAAPNGPSRQRLIREALSSARLSAADVDVVEAHGTGTAIGDSIEAQAVLATYGQDRPAGRPVLMGSIKPNLGHPQAAAGIASVLKMVLAMRHEQLPATLHIDRPSPLVNWRGGSVSLLTEPVPWPRGDRPRRAAVSAFGVSGTNGHVILEEPPETPEPAGGMDGAAVWVLSARSPEALRGQAGALAARLTADPGLSPVDVGWSLATTRSVFEHRAVVLGADRKELEAALAALSLGASHPRVVAPGVVKPVTGKIGFVFTGQPEPLSGAELYDRFPVFAAAYDEVCAQFDAGLPRPLREVAFDGGPDHPLHAPAGTFAREVALARLLISAGIRPKLLTGQGTGEIAAAHVAGLLDLADAARLITLSAALGGRTDLPDRFRQIIGGLTHLRPKIPVAADGPGYWIRFFQEPGRPRAAVPKGCVLLALGTEALAEEEVPVLDRDRPEVEALTWALARLHTDGRTVDWAALYDGGPARRTVDLPTYAFQRSRYWLAETRETEASPETADSGFWDAVERRDPETLASMLGPVPDQRVSLTDLADWRHRRRLSYRVAWKVLPDVSVPRLTGTWLLVTGRAGGPVATAVAGALRRYGADVVETSAQLTEDPDVAGVLSLLAVETRSGTTATTALIETLGTLGVTAPVWSATHGAVGVDAGDPVTRPEQAELWGLAGRG